ncbi:uncharacterized protein B0H18DRAFT_880670 [Fomitopsis serialis]|uniref:uncharacterized protein n=1 Tax=Fomitopsis serialis TaxID=139415 RepID=UPI0020089094|nr:uncharacterized protein B0H18DRAFT_880670 [Neoantrodia serialis]KAH9920957.1 hypothetical protein B0H18DRAFT_880670 [Neoantrodia serialis]
MSARRQASTTSLSKFVRANSPEFSNRSLDFCNAFWGLGDGGVDVLFARMRGASRTMEELRSFWKERAAIEEQYAKRLAALSKVTLGRDEIGEMRLTMDTLKGETEKQAGYHQLVAQQIKNELEAQAAAFVSRQQHHKKTIQIAIEREFKTKQTQESYVQKAREKYESDCMKINSLTAQSTLEQGKELQKTRERLERARQTVRANEQDFSNFTRALQETVRKWEIDWKAFCDSCQDMEEERMEFTKDNIWAYANAISTVCVADDESCEKVRLALESMEVDRDMENFVRDYGTGSQIPDPPVFVDYSNPNTIPSSGQQITTRPAAFVRSTQRSRQAPPSPPPPQEEEPPVNMTGVGRAGGRQTDGSDVGPQGTDSRNGASAYVNGHSVSPGPGAPSRGPPSQGGMRAPEPQADPIDPTAETMLKIGERAYPVDPSRDPQGQRGGSKVAAPRPLNVGQDDDPLAQQMVALQKGGGSTRRQSQYQPQGAYPTSTPSPTKRDATANKLSPPPDGSSRSGRRNSVDYRRSAEIVVGAPPASDRRSTSPNPYPKHMLPPSNVGPSGNLPVQEILHDYEQSFPGERKSISRPGSRPGSVIGLPGQGPSPSQSQIQSTRPMSGQAGIGAQGRSPSPQPFAPPSRSTSPAVPQPPNARRLSTSRVPPPSMNGAPAGHHATSSVSSVRPGTGTIQVPQPSAQHQRPTSPNSVGIVLDPTGRVALDEMASRYQPPPPQQPQYGRPPQQQPPATQVQRQPTYNTPGYPQQPVAGHVQQPSHGPPVPYGGPPQTIAAPNYYPPQPPPPQQQYGQQPPPPVQYQQPHQQQPSYQQPNGYQSGVVPSQQRTPSGYFGQDPYGQQQQQQYRAPSPARAPSPQPPPGQAPPPPTGAYTEDGRGILFYVKAMYDYQATIEEEFDFQAGDIIAVTATPEDGWWSGELLDEQRRQPGRHVFPSNFVCLF